MKKGLFILFFALSFGFADTALLLHKGWQLIGSSSKITDMQIFDRSHVEQIWHYDAQKQQWLGFSPDPHIQNKITRQGYETISELQSWHGFWIKSRDAWALTLPSDKDRSDENITLLKGWNLISLPVDTVVSPHIFDGKTVWKYTQSDGWKQFDDAEQNDYPPIQHISSADGIWVKSDRNQTISTVTDAAELHNFKSIDELKSYIRDMLLTYQRPVCGYYPLPLLGNIGQQVDDTQMAPAGDGSNGDQKSGATDTTQTNLQESGVDEADIIKHNNQAIFYLYYDTKKGRTLIGVTTFSQIIAGRDEPLQTIIPEKNPVNLYLSDNKLIVLSDYYSSYKPLPQEKARMREEEERGSHILVEIYDISDISAIKKEERIKIEGTLNDSRRIGDKLYLVTQFQPEVTLTYPRIYVDAPECKEYFSDTPYSNDSGGNDQESTESNGIKPSRLIAPQEYGKYARCYDLYRDETGRFYRKDYDHPNIVSENLLPYYYEKDTKKLLIEPKYVYASDIKEQQPVITTLIQIDTEQGKVEKHSAFLGYTNTLYASTDAIYLVSDRYPIFYGFDRYETRSAIYRFDLNDGVTYDAFGFIKGTPLNQFSLSEYDGYLRIATTEGSSWQENTDNRLYTLKAYQHHLLIEGVLGGLGEKGEMIRSVRFMGPRGYIVTFRQTDPFYTLDLSDPTHPQKVGELKVDGFSSYLHPINEDLILGIGRDATPEGRQLGLKLELFDISDFASPKSLDSYTLPYNYAWSEVEHNHKALAYRNTDHLIAFAYNAILNQNRYEQAYLGVYQIEGQKISVYTPIEMQTDINIPFRGYQRGIIFDMNDETYIAYFSNGKIGYRKLQDLNKER
jgi:uncharacterized secreted protein with C-terminal beta-propeller domain